MAPLRRTQVIADRYELQHEVGRGGMGEVWLALDRELDRPVALKFHDRQASEARFEREAHTAAALSHPNIVCIYDYGLANGRPYLVLEHLAGGTLADRLASADALADSEAEQIARDIAAALAHAHAQGVVHRDLKPSNILFGADGRAKLVDFGIARSSGQRTLTEAGSLLGTAAYMSPEQAAGKAPIGAATDVYAFGVILFQMLTGRLPFEGNSPLELAFKHRTAAPPALDSYRRDAPPRLASLVARAREGAGRPPAGWKRLIGGTRCGDSKPGSYAGHGAPPARHDAATEAQAEGIRCIGHSCGGRACRGVVRTPCRGIRALSGTGWS